MCSGLAAKSLPPNTTVPGTLSWIHADSGNCSRTPAGHDEDGRRTGTGTREDGTAAHFPHMVGGRDSLRGQFARGAIGRKENGDDPLPRSRTSGSALGSNHWTSRVNEFSLAERAQTPGRQPLLRGRRKQFSWSMLNWPGRCMLLPACSLCIVRAPAGGLPGHKYRPLYVGRREVQREARDKSP